MKYTEDELLEMLHDAGLRVTPHRFLVFSIVSKSRSPLTVQTIVDKARKKEDIDQATVYRNLLSLNNAGLLRRLDFNHGHAHYELDRGDSSHQLVCTNCETIEKIEGISLDEVIKKMVKKSRKFKSTTTSSIEIYGFCKNCA